MTESFAELFEASLSNTQLKPGAIVIGTVLDITSDAVIVNAGLKSEGVIPRPQFLNPDGEIEVTVGESCPGCRRRRLWRNPALPRKGQA